MILLRFQAADALHLAKGMAMYARWARDNGIQLPEAVRRLPEVAHQEASEGQGGPSFPSLDELAHGGVVPEALTYEAAAAFLGVSRTTLKRLVASGALPLVSVGGPKRIRRADLTEYLADLKPENGVPA